MKSIADKQPQIGAVSEFLIDFAMSLMSAGTQTSRVMRNIDRLAETWGYKSYLIILPRTVIITLEGSTNKESVTILRKVPSLALNARLISELRILSWEIYTHKFDLDECKKRYEKLLHLPRLSGYKLAFTAALGNGAFCQLFGGFYSIPAVFLGTLLGFIAKNKLTKYKMHHLLVFVISAFISAFTVGLIAKIFDFQTDIGISTSVLFLIPGIPLMNSIIDIVDGHILAGISRLINALTLVFALTLGLLLAIFALGIHIL